ncbi:hypothetical protein F4808DRAFT_472619 [Astrocystis sublimbata]|nr:hypothetical protein F4808DRAFT_472619 [Astrocystis sublimbata]
MSITLAPPVDGLRLAVNDFLDALTDDQRLKLETDAVPNADSIHVFAAELDSVNRRNGQNVGSRLYTILGCVRDYCSIVDTFVSSHPETAALVWGSIRLTMQIAVNYTSYYEAITEWLMELGHHCPLFTEYGTLYRSSKQLQDSLSSFQASIIRCCKHIVEVIQRPSSWSTKVQQAFWASFNREFQPDKDEIRRSSDKVKHAICIAKAHIDAQERKLHDEERKLQDQERAEAAKGRTLLRTFSSRAHSDNEYIRVLLLQREERDQQERKQKLLEAICTYNPERILKQNQRKRFCSTTEWIFQTPEFRKWNDIKGSSLLWCSGKIGSGKSVVSASVVDYLLVQKGCSDVLVSYFFAHYSDQESLRAETIMRSLVRQRLPVSTQLSREMEEKLKQLEDDTDLYEVVNFLRDTTSESKPSYIIVDGLDECDQSNGTKLLKALSSLVASTTSTKLFLASRESLSEEIRRSFGSMNQVSMNNSKVSDDITTYIDGKLAEKLQKGYLKVGDPKLIGEIAQALAQGADGMFLWVHFQVREVCEQDCDENIRKFLKNLPKTLEALFCRVLRRILDRKHEKITIKVFTWIAASTRPLTLEEIREAIAIEISQQYTKPERLHNDIDGIASVCGNLVHVDEECRSIQFAHHTVQRFLVQQSSLPLNSIDYGLHMFFIDIEEADHFIGEICVTYLEFNDFKTTLSRQAKPVQLPMPHDIAEAALSKKFKRLWKIMQKYESRGALAPVHYDPSDHSNESSTTSQTIHNAHPFLKYASTNWIQHTKRFHNMKSKMWTTWRNIIINGHDLASKPWQPESLKLDDHAILEWARKADHYALIRLIISDRELTSQEKTDIVIKAFERHSPVEFRIFLMNDMHDAIDQALQAVAGPVRSGHLAIVERLLAAGANVNAAAARYDGRTALQAAAENGYLDIVEILLVAEADVNAAAAEVNGCTALRAALWGDNLEIVERLRQAGAKEYCDENYDGFISLQVVNK